MLILLFPNQREFGTLLVFFCLFIYYNVKLLGSIEIKNLALIIHQDKIEKQTSRATKKKNQNCNKRELIVKKKIK